MDQYMKWLNRLYLHKRQYEILCYQAQHVIKYRHSACNTAEAILLGDSAKLVC